MINHHLFTRLTSHEAQRYTKELELALDAHVRWLDKINTTLLFDLQPDSRDLAEEPHLHCQFGRWYHGVDDSVIQAMSAFEALDHAHRDLHALAKRLLMQNGRGEPISQFDYRMMLEKSLRMRDLITRLRVDFRQDLHLISRLMSKVFDNAGDGVIVTGPDGKILHANRAFTEITGYSIEEAVGRTPGLLSSGRHDETFYERMWQVLTDSGHWEGEIWNRRKDGSIYVEWLSISAIQDDMGKAVSYVGIFSDINKGRENEERLYQLAHYDGLTGLPNRMLFEELFRQALRRARRNGEMIAVMFLDLDGFKLVNDTLGHHSGDLLLKQVAARLRRCLRASDTVARFGGDEFTIVAHDLTSEAIHILSEKVVRALADPYLLNDEEWRITVSLGVSCYPADGSDPEKLLRCADIAMYQVKEAGKNGYRVFEPGMTL